MFGTYLPNPGTGKYVVIAPPGKYNLTMEAPGFQDFSENISILDKSSFQTEIEKDISLLPKGYKPSVPVKKLKK